jgi:hypothetical protein
VPLTEKYLSITKTGKSFTYADHHSITATAMNFSLSRSMVSRCKALKGALKQAALKARKLRSGPKPQFSRGRMMVYLTKSAKKDRMRIRSPAVKFKVKYARISRPTILPRVYCFKQKKTLHS